MCASHCPGALNMLCFFDFSTPLHWRNIKKPPLLREKVPILIPRIGVSNYELPHLDEMDSVPDVLQIEFHPWWNRADLLQWCRERKVKLVAYSSLGGAKISKLILEVKRSPKGTLEIGSSLHFWSFDRFLGPLKVLSSFNRCCFNVNSIRLTTTNPLFCAVVWRNRQGFAEVVAPASSIIPAYEAPR